MRPAEPSDIPAIHELVRRSEVHDAIPFITTIDEIQQLFEASSLNAELDTRVVEDGGRIVAFGHIWHQPSGVRQERAYLDGMVDPEYRRRGLGTRLIGWQLDRARTLLEAYDHDLPRYIRVEALEWLDNHHLYEAVGFEPVRWNQDMVRPLTDIPPAAEIPGIVIVPWSDEHREAARQVNNAAFADHWGSTPKSVEAWNERILDFGTRLDLSFLALAGDEPVGLVINGHFAGDQAVTGRLDGWIETLAVLAGWRKRGVATALIQRSLEAFQAEGFSHAMIGVDSDNPTGASRLYQNLGFEVNHRTITREIEVTPPPTAQ